ncbi:hypothetical protein RYX36_001076 [Vicia faba]
MEEEVENNSQKVEDGMETYLSEATRVELSDRQLQMWFCHRRLKDKELPSKKLPPSPDSATDELRAVACVEAKLGEPLREDGPIPGIEFDPLPPDAFGAPLALAYDTKIYKRHQVRTNKAMTRTFPEHTFVPNPPSIRSDTFEQLSQPHLYDPMEGPTKTPPFLIGNDHLPRIHNTRSHSSRARHSSHASSRARHSSQQDKQVNPYNDAVLRVEKKRKSDDTRVVKEVEAYEIKLKKELEKQVILRKKVLFNEQKLLSCII